MFFCPFNNGFEDVWLFALAGSLVVNYLLVKLRSQLLGHPGTQGLFDELAGLPALTAGKPLGLDTRFAVCGDGNFNGPTQDAPPI